MALWLTTCREETGSLQKLYAKYKDGASWSWASTRLMLGTLPWITESNKVTFPNVLDSSDAANRAIMQYETLGGMSAVP